jgi:hypothetical protein
MESRNTVALACTDPATGSDSWPVSILAGLNAPPIVVAPASSDPAEPVGGIAEDMIDTMGI